MMRNGRMLRVIAGGAVLAVMLGTGASGVTLKRRARVAAGYIVDLQEPNGSVPSFSTIGSTADAVISLVAARRGPDEITDALQYLEDNQAQVDTVGEIGKVAMALVAAGQDPRDFAGRDLIQEIHDMRLESGRYGMGTAVFDHALAMLAVGAAGGNPRRPAEWLAKAQCRDGGWQYDKRSRSSDNKHCYSGEGDFFLADADTTALAVQALELTGRHEELKKGPFDYFQLARDDVKNGWRYDHRFKPFGTPTYTNANSTALVLQAFAARGREAPEKGVEALEDLQYRLCGENAGAFAYTWAKEDGGLRKDARNLGATIGAIPGLLSTPFPLDGGSVVDKPAPQPGPC